MTPRIAAFLMVSLTAAAQTPQTKSPVYINEPVTRMVPHCEVGWHLEQWHYGKDDMNTFVVAVYVSDPSGYRAVSESKEENLHPDRCVKDEPKK